MFRRPDPYDNARDMKEKLWTYANLVENFFIPRDAQLNEFNKEVELEALEKLKEFLIIGHIENLEKTYETWKTKIDGWMEIFVKEKITKLSRENAQKSFLEAKEELKTETVNSQLDWYQSYSIAIDLFNEAVYQLPPDSLIKLQMALEYCERSRDINAYFPHLYYLRGKIWERYVDEPDHLQKALKNFKFLNNWKPFKRSHSPENKEIRALAKQKIIEIGEHCRELVVQANQELEQRPQSKSSLEKALEVCNKAIVITDDYALAFYIRGRIHQALAGLEADTDKKNEIIDLAITDLRKCCESFKTYKRSLTDKEQDANEHAEKRLKKLICSKIQVECDIDNTLVAGEDKADNVNKMKEQFTAYKALYPSMPEVNALKFLNPKYVKYGEEHYYVIFPGAIEFRKWADDVGINFSYYSTGMAERNILLCELFHLELGLPKTLPVRATSRDGCYSLDEEKVPALRANTVNCIQEQSKKFGIPLHLGHKKALARLHQKNLDYTVLIDNLLPVIFPGEEKNALCTNSDVGPYDFMLDFNDKNNRPTIEQILKLNQIFGIVGVMNEALGMTVENGKPFLDNLFSLQFKLKKQPVPTSQLFQQIDETYTPVKFSAKKRLKYFESGLEILRKYNPNLQFYGHDLLYKLVFKEEKQAALQKALAKSSLGTP